MPYCPNCGTEVDKDARICTNCDYPLQSQQPPTTKPQQFDPVARPQQFDPVARPQRSVDFRPAQPQEPASFPTSGQPYSSPQQTDGQATAALVLGILGIVLCPIVLSIVALILGKQSMNRIRQSGGALGGYGQAQAGFVLGIIGLVLPLLIAIPFILFAVFAGTASFG